MRDFFTAAEGLPLAGFSVTIPHKQKIVRYLDSVDPVARRIGAVNTVWRRGGKWRGANTDVTGVTGPLARVLTLRNASVLMVGNGGAARGAAFALAGVGAQISIAGRNLDRVRALARVCGAEALGREQLSGRHFDAVVHATPLGMYPQVGGCFFEGEIPGEVVFDLVYNPSETELLKKARAQGKTGDSGIGDVHRASGGAVRDLDRRNGAARGHDQGGGRSAGRRLKAAEAPELSTFDARPRGCATQKSCSGEAP